MSNFKPLLSATVTKPELINFPVLVSPKLDGIRCIILNGAPVSRKLIHIPNIHILKTLTGLPLLDGELFVGDSMYTTESGVMSIEGEPDFTFHVFDTVTSGSFESRYQDVVDFVNFENKPFLKVVPHHRVNNLSQLMEYEDHFVTNGYEGIMIRSLDGKYKYGRSTENEGILMKLKRFHDAEGVIVGFKEKLHNANEAKTDALGHTKRATNKANKVGLNTLGALILTSDAFPLAKEIRIGSGFDADLCKEIWMNRDKYVDKVVKFKYQEVTVHGSPRFGVFLGFRQD